MGGAGKISRLVVSADHLIHCRRILCALMANEKCSKICYGAQEMVEILYTHFNLSITGTCHVE